MSLLAVSALSVSAFAAPVSSSTAIRVDRDPTTNASSSVTASTDSPVTVDPSQASGQIKVVYQDANGWHSEILVPFGKDLGTKTYPMYAAYLYFAGETYEGVWNEDIQSIVSSLSVSSH